MKLPFTVIPIALLEILLIAPGASFLTIPLPSLESKWIPVELSPILIRPPSTADPFSILGGSIPLPNTSDSFESDIQ